MLPVSRRDEYFFSVPKFDLGKGDIKGFMNELVGFHEQFFDFRMNHTMQDSPPIISKKTTISIVSYVVNLIIITFAIERIAHLGDVPDTS